MYTDFPPQSDLANFESPAERRDCATHFLIVQTKKVHQDMKKEEKKAAETAQAAAAGIAKRTKRTTVPAAPATPGTRGTPRITVAPTAPGTLKTRRAPRSPLANRLAPGSSSPLANRGALTTWKRIRFHDDEDEVPRCPSGPSTIRQRQVELPELRFSSFSVSFRILASNRIHSTIYDSVNEFPRLVFWARERALQLSIVPILLKTTITLRNDKCLDIFPGVDQGGKVELGISDQG